jgi:glyoxylase-like metal-dependent hydrolase (beta-lactamase superfamily II)
MAYDSVQIGNIELLALIDGDQDLSEPITSSFADIPTDDLLAFKEREPALYGPDDVWHLWVRAWLIRHPAGMMLVDTGVGQAAAPAPAWFGAPGRLLDVLHETGTPPDAIDTVVLTHVHDDHIGGTVVFDHDGTPTPAFPNARYVLQHDDREWQRQLAREDPEDRVMDTLLLQPLERAGVLDVVEGDHTLADGLDARHAPGHTPGHQVVRIRSRNARAIITADAFNHPIQIGHPDWPSSTDDVPARAAMSRRSLLAEVLSHPGTTIAPTHFPNSFGQIRSGADGLAAWVAS